MFVLVDDIGPMGLFQTTLALLLLFDLVEPTLHFLRHNFSFEVAFPEVDHYAFTSSFQYVSKDVSLDFFNI